MLLKNRTTIITYALCLVIVYVLIDLPALKRHLLISSGIPATAVALGFEEERNLRGRAVDWHVTATFELESGRTATTNVSMASAEYRSLKTAVAAKERADDDLGRRLSEAIGQEVTARVVTQDDRLAGHGGVRFPIRYRPESPEVAAYDYKSFLAHSNIVVMPIALGLFLVIFGIVWSIRAVRQRIRTFRHSR